MENRKSIFYQSRLEAAKVESRLKSQEFAAEIIGIEPSTLSRYENNKREPDGAIIIKMSEVYDDPILLNQYCCNNCLIGKKLNKKIYHKSLEILAINAALELQKTSMMKNTLLEVAADGIISDDEKEEFKKVVQYFDSISTLAKEVKILARKLKII